jgi:hypothetical protein
MVYSKAFDGMPLAVREEFFHRLWDILNREGGVEGFQHLGAEEKTNLVEILRDTKKDLPNIWHGEVKGVAGR